MKKIILFLIMLQYCNLQAQQLNMTVKSNGTNKSTVLSNVRRVTFKSFNNTGLAVKDTTITIVKKTGTQVTYSMYDIDKIFFEYKTTTSVQNAVSDITFYPNPSSDVIFIKIDKENTHIEIYNINGNKVLSTKSTNGTTQINISGLNKGLYLIKISDIKTLKFQKI